MVYDVARERVDDEIFFSSSEDDRTWMMKSLSTLDSRSLDRNSERSDEVSSTSESEKSTPVTGK